MSFENDCLLGSYRMKFLFDVHKNKCINAVNFIACRCGYCGYFNKVNRVQLLENKKEQERRAMLESKKVKRVGK